ncbi:MAG: putative formate dehydrogenase cytochrome b subunit [Candidatus Scalindua rubra]|uniref:Putative formate dehydrogenase cytochrome b subunit n=1 Tax=Candidatus Scalindua rubra TaxID=1872076 RepID=A0A1E3XE07_9BACT|nr:MAG: putative formate dehydrogenase cytochrome b subunit [Candidatus Scalindua rubra]
MVSLLKTFLEVYDHNKISKVIFLSFLLLFISTFSSKNLFAQENSECLECHTDPEEVDIKVRVDPVTGDVEIVSMLVDEEAFHASAHGGEDFYCIDCHADLEDVDLEETEGGHYPNLQPVDCITFCHDDPAEEYLEGSHVQLMRENDIEPIPTCKHCHAGEKSKRDTPKADDLYHRKDTIEKCGECHIEYFHSYRNNLHGQITALGHLDTDIATCVDCHGQHTILNSSDPESTLGPENAIETCGNCHPGANDSFIKHVAHPQYKNLGYYKSALVALKNIRKDPGQIESIVKSPQIILTILFVIYIGLLLMTFTQFGAHTLLSWLGTILDERKGKESEHDK